MCEITNQEVLELNISKELYIQYGRFCERHGIKNYKDINNYEDYLNYGANKWEDGASLGKYKKYYIEIVIKNQITNFLQGLISSQYKVILVDNKYPITIDDDLEYWLYELMDNVSHIVRHDDVLNVIHKDKTKLRLIGYEDMSDGEIFARRYLGECEYDDLIIKDSLNQVNFREDNFKNTKDYYNRCGDITNIRLVPEDSKYYNMNWDCIIVGYGKHDDYTEEIWQRA